MTTDEIQLLRDLRSNVPEPDEETMRRAYAYATSQPPVASRARIGLPRTSRARILGIAAIAGAAALVGLFAVPAMTSHHGSGGRGFNGSVAEGQGGSSGLAPIVVPLSRAMRDASKWFGAPLILPNTPVLKPSDAASMASEEWLPSSRPGVQEPLSQVLVQFTSPFVSITYAPTAMTSWGAHYPDALDQYRAEIAQARNASDYKIVSLSDGTPALVGVGKTGNSFEFRLGKLSIIIWAPNNNGVQTSVGAAKLRALAQSIADQAARANQSGGSK